MTSDEAMQQKLDAMIAPDLQSLYEREVRLYKAAWREAVNWCRRQEKLLQEEVSGQSV